MTAALVSRINLDRLYPAFRDRLLDTLADCLSAGHEYHATTGWRSFEAEDALYTQGRTLPGPVITHARGGQSAHNFGLAVDVVAIKPRLYGQTTAADWAPEAYEALGFFAQRRGLVWGGAWTAFPDRPHVQLPKYITAWDLAPLRSAWLDGFDGNIDAALSRAWTLIP